MQDINSENNLKNLKVGDHVQYDSPTVIDNHHWIWQGTVIRVTWKFVYISWTHSNSPVFPGPIVEDEAPHTGYFTRAYNNMNISLIVPPAPEPVATIEDLKNLSLDQVSEMYRNGTISEALTEEYIELWNRGPHFTKAQLSDGVIRNYLAPEPVLEQITGPVEPCPPILPRL